MFSISDIIYLAIGVILSMSIHEVAHGLVSYWMGDPTAKLEGRLSLNPFKHIDWAGLVCLLFFGFGWAKPVPIDSRYYKDAKTGIIWTSFAGPVANFLLSFICVFLFYALYKFAPQFIFTAAGNFISSVLSYTGLISTGFGIFNLIPIPPLDGSKVVFSFLPDDKYYKFIEGAPWMNFLFIALIFTGVLNSPLGMLRAQMISFFEMVAKMILGF
ncbi:site-2 protease family protein [Holdemanella biformis]|jgi:Zn-dependent protease|uniref:site-2 protease family protein n=2 Tax=Holdemanella biformis TaxID=1735 RepID=UPI001C26EEB3|nr:site-2 protease family protein [Holdemanella biformis]MBU9894991.1 site-2 protease family protein [Holdemanella biformis]MBV3416029.1 site-2 protease family protein [Holdemanella biformis]